MTIREHTIQAAVGSAIMTPFLGVDTLIFFVSMILIDIDHYFEYVFVCGRFDIKGMFKFHDFVCKNRESVYGFSLFHTVEVFSLFFILGFWSYYFWLILFGFSVHLMFDLYYLYVHNCFFNRAFSIVEYLIRGYGLKCYPIPEKEFWGNTK